MYALVNHAPANTVMSAASSTIAHPAPSRRMPRAKCSTTIETSSAKLNITSTSLIVWLGKWLTSTPRFQIDTNIVAVDATSTVMAASFQTFRPPASPDRDSR